MEEEENRRGYVFILLGLSFLGLYLTSLYSYPLFHSLAELFSIVIACGIFIIAWNARRFLDQHYLLFIGIAYLFVAFLDIIHTLAYKGMGVFKGFDANFPTQLWIIARYMESISLLIAPYYLKRSLKVDRVFIVYLLTTILLLLSIFSWDLFPNCFIEGKGLTPFKITSEYIISSILGASMILLWVNRQALDPKVFQLVIWSIVTTIISELAFTFYISVYGLSNLIGHYFKIISFYFIYKAIIETGLTKPYDLLFRNLKLSKEEVQRERDFAESLVNTAQVITLLLDPQGRIIRFNPYMEEISGYSIDEARGKDWFDTFLPEKDRGMIRKLFSKAIDNIQTRGNINPILTKTGEERLIEWNDKTLKDAEGKTVGLLAIGQDITQRKQTEEDRERLIKDLQKALLELKTLSGFLPICMSCKKIRDDKGYWEQVEVYIRDHSEVEFSHSLCPECMRRLYPDEI